MASQRTRLHVLIIGGGIGGLCLAQGLRRAGVSVAVYERDRTRTNRLEGFRIHINPAGSRALHACLPPDLWEALVATAGRPGGTGFVTEQLKELVVVDEALMYPATANPAESQHAVDRRTLRRLLLSGLDGTVHFDKQFESYKRTPEGKVTAFFADGSSATGDILVGADGATSRVRQQYLPQVDRVETDAIAVGHKLPLTEQSRAWLPRGLATRMNVVMTTDPFFLFTAAFDPRATLNEAPPRTGNQPTPQDPDPSSSATLNSDDDSYILCAFVAHRDAFPPNVAELDGAQLQRLVQTMVRHWHPDLRQIISASDPDSVALVPFKYSLPPTTWTTTNVTVLGDAIHSMPPAPGLGGNTALRDAHLLSRTLAAAHRGERPIPEAIQDYENEMIQYGSAAVRAALDTTRQGISSNRLIVTTGKTWFRICAAISPLKQLTFKDMWGKHARPRPGERELPGQSTSQ